MTPLHHHFEMSGGRRRIVVRFRIIAMMFAMMSAGDLEAEMSKILVLGAAKSGGRLGELSRRARSLRRALADKNAEPVLPYEAGLARGARVRRELRLGCC